MGSTFRRARRFLLTGAAFVGLWAAVVILLRPPAYILPAPWRVAMAIEGYWHSYARHTGATLLASAAGLALAVAVAAPAAVTCVMLRSTRPALEAVAVVLRTLPIVAIAPIITLWFGTGLAARVVIAAVVCFFPLFSGFVRGMSQADPVAVRIMRLYGATPGQTFRHLRLPSAVPQLVAAAPLAATLAVLGALVAEFCASDVGLGSLVLRGLFRLNSEMLYAANVLSAVVGVGFYLASSALEYPFRRYAAHRDVDQT